MSRRQILGAVSSVARGWLLVVTLAAAGAAGAAGYALTAAPRYEASATFVVAPVSGDDPTLIGIDVLHDTGRRTAAETAARLVQTPAIADAARVRLALPRSPAQVLEELSTHVLPGSEAVAVTATDADPVRAAQLANAVVDAFFAVRTGTFDREVAAAVRRLRARLAALPRRQRSSAQGVALQKRLAATRALVGTSDPTLRHGTAALAPTSAVWPDPPRLALLGGLAGLGAGCLAALGLGAAAAARRRGVASDPERYDRVVSERLIDRLEQRVAERLDVLIAEQERLAARESALATRERELAARLDEVPAAAPVALPAPAGEPVLAGRERAVAERERRLDELERDLGRRLAEIETAEAWLRERAAELGRRRDARAAQAPAPAPAPVAAPAPAQPQTAAPAPGEQPSRAGQGWRFADLQQLVAEHAAAEPHRLDEWNSYLFYLRDYVTPDGRVPARFDWVIDDAFGDLLRARA